MGLDTLAAGPTSSSCGVRGGAISAAAGCRMADEACKVVHGEVEEALLTGWDGGVVCKHLKCMECVCVRPRGLAVLLDCLLFMESALRTSQNSRRLMWLRASH